MLISLKTYNRGKLKPEQQEFLLKIVPLARLIAEWTQAKAEFLGIPNARGFKTSFILGDILYFSQFGEHPVSLEQFNNRYANNLGLIQADRYWRGKTHLFRGILYRAYQDWRSFAVDYSDYYCFSRRFDKILSSSNLLEQIELMSLTKINPLDYNTEVIITITSLGLEEFDTSQRI